MTIQRRDMTWIAVVMSGDRTSPRAACKISRLIAHWNTNTIAPADACGEEGSYRGNPGETWSFGDKLRGRRKRRAQQLCPHAPKVARHDDRLDGERERREPAHKAPADDKSCQIEKCVRRNFSNTRDFRARVCAARQSLWAQTMGSNAKRALFAILRRSDARGIVEHEISLDDAHAGAGVK